jgi:hypothetical protein
VVQSSLMQAHEKPSATRSGRTGHDPCHQNYQGIHLFNGKRMRRDAFEVQQVNVVYNVVGLRMDGGLIDQAVKLFPVAIFLPEASICRCNATRISSNTD